MRYLILLFSINSFANDFVTRDYTQQTKRVLESHFTFSIDLSYNTYKTDHVFSGVTTNTNANTSISKDDSAKYWGPNIGVGYRWFLNHRLSFALQGDLFYHFLRKRHTQKYSEDFPEKVMERENFNHMFGLKASPKLIYRIPVKSKTFFEPYAIGQIGYGLVRSKYDLFYDDLVLNHDYESKVKESFLITGIGFGFNVMNRNGLYIYLQGLKTFYSLGSSTIKTTNQSEQDLPGDSSRSEVSASLGFGYVY